MLRSIDWLLNTNVSEQRIGPIFKDQAIQTAVQRQALWNIAVNSMVP